MNSRRLGVTDVEVPLIGPGYWRFAQGKGFTGSMWSVLDQGTIDALTRAALDGGISPEHARQSTATVKLRLTDAELARLDGIPDGVARRA
jgi:aryl-alcohol dehydrogenase-like predicted oxidoreductase